jgi:hypothetical protein
MDTDDKTIASNENFFIFPTRKDWREILQGSVFSHLEPLIERLEAQDYSTNNKSIIFKELEIQSWFIELRNRISDMQISYYFLMFYYGKGIPDNRWNISPGENGSSIQYFPDFKEAHYLLKTWFDYFSDTFYYKLFSSLDIIGHIINVKYELDIQNNHIYFTNLVNELKNKDNSLFLCLDSIFKSPAYNDANRIRNNITHNFLPSSVGMYVIRDGKSGGIGIKKYVTSENIVSNIQNVLRLFVKTLEYINGDSKTPL